MSGRRVLVTGINGMLGSNILKFLNYESIVNLPRSFDIRDTKSIDTLLTQEKPEIIIHTAAYTDVEGCEVNIDKAYSVNVTGTQNLVNYCIDKNILFIYISSTGLYGEEKDVAYTEFDSALPTTIHHKSKLEGEKVVQNQLSKYLILRTGWLYGGDQEHSKNFVYRRYLEAQDKEVIYSDSSQIGNPTYIVDFVEQMNLLIDKKQYGIFNCVNEATNISRYDYVKKIIALFEVNCKVKVAPMNMFKRIAPVSKNESAINYKLNLLGLNIMGDWEVSLKKYIDILKSEI